MEHKTALIYGITIVFILPMAFKYFNVECSRLGIFLIALGGVALMAFLPRDLRMLNFPFLLLLAGIIVKEANLKDVMYSIFAVNGISLPLFLAFN